MKTAIVHVPSMQPAVPIQASTDAQVIDLWLHGRSVHTKRAYRADADRFFGFVDQKSLHVVSVSDIQAFADSLRALSTSTQVRILSAVRSLLTYAHQRIGYLRYNPGAAIQLPKVKNTLAERILSEEDVHKMLAVSEGRDHLIVRLLYGAGVRVSELCSLRWCDVQERDNAGQITVFGKGGKTRVILLSTTTWRCLIANRPVDADKPVIVSRKGGCLDVSQVYRVVQRIAGQAGVKGNVSPHWLRHAHASHALDRSAPIHLVQATLGHASVATTGRYLHVRPNDSSGRYLPV